MCSTHSLPVRKHLVVLLKGFQFDMTQNVRTVWGYQRVNQKPYKIISSTWDIIQCITTSSVSLYFPALKNCVSQLIDQHSSMSEERFFAAFVLLGLTATFLINTYLILGAISTYMYLIALWILQSHTANNKTRSIMNYDINIQLSWGERWLLVLLILVELLTTNSSTVFVHKFLFRQLGLIC
jgi:hypothetical protein